MSKPVESGVSEWAKHLRKDGKRQANKAARRASKKAIHNY